MLHEVQEWLKHLHDPKPKPRVRGKAKAKRPLRQTTTKPVPSEDSSKPKVNPPAPSTDTPNQSTAQPTSAHPASDSPAENQTTENQVFDLFDSAGTPMRLDEHQNERALDILTARQTYTCKYRDPLEPLPEVPQQPTKGQPAKPVKK